jgi:hypothetical protein
MFSLQPTNLGAAITFPFWPYPQRDVHLKSVSDKLLRTGPEEG